KPPRYRFAEFPGRWGRRTMSILASIRNHSRRGYLSLQFLCGASALILAGSLIATAGDTVMFWALSFCLIANLLAIAIFAYLQRSIIIQLDRATVDEAEKQHRAVTDTLTGAMMRGHFLEELKHSVGRPLEPRQATLVLVDRSEEHTSELQSRENLVCR